MSGFDPAWHPQPATLRAIPPQQPQYGASRGVTPGGLSLKVGRCPKEQDH